jgi:hypothetical protein
MTAEVIEHDVRVPGIMRLLFLGATVTVLLDLLGLAITLLSGHDSIFGLLGVINLDGERGVGTLFQLFLLMLSVALFIALGRLARAGRADRGPWFFLAGVFAFLTLDEFAFLHERLMDPMRRLVGSDGVLHFAWVVPYGIAVAVLALWIGPKILAIRPGPRAWFLLAAAAYLTGALGFEMLSGWRLTAIGGEANRPELIYELLTTVEETLEMVGLILLIRGQLELLHPSVRRIEISVAS